MHYAYHSPLLQDEFELIPEDNNYLGFMLHPSLCEERDGIYISRGTIPNSYSSSLLTDTLDCFNQGETNYKIRVSLGNNNHINYKINNENMHIMEYTDQLKELSHSSLFITHGGITGVREAIFCETPMLVIPASFPEFQVGSAIVRQNAGLMAEERPINREEIISKCEDIITNHDRYRYVINKIKKELGDYWNQIGILELIRKCEELL